MDKRFEKVSMNGRMAYVIMCVESYLVGKYPDRDWTPVSKRMWKATCENWGDWVEEYSTIIPDVILQYDKYDKEALEEYLTRKEYNALKVLYSGITDGNEENPSDEVNYMLNRPFEMAMVYEGTSIGDGKESLEIISAVETVLSRNEITPPDDAKVQFSSIEERNGWGNDFDGEYLSIVLNK